MATWCVDPVASRAAGRRIFKLPYPGGSWYDEKEANTFLLEAMAYTAEAVLVFTKDSQKWKDKETKFFLAMMKGLNA